MIRITFARFCLRAPGEDDAPAAVHPAVHLAGGGAAVQAETKGGATAHTGHAAETGGKTGAILTFCQVYH